MLRANRIYHLDALEGLQKLENESVDLIVTDPPYNLASKSRKTLHRGKAITTMKLWGSWDGFHPFDYDLFILKLLSQFYRVLKKGGALYMFAADQHSSYFVRKAVQRGFRYGNHLAIVTRNPMPSLGKRNWRRAFQLCFYVTKGKPKTFNFLSQRECINIFSYSVRDKQTQHPSEKPIEFIKKIIEVSSNKDELVVDPFLGSGTTAVACKFLGRKYIGFDQDAGYISLARKRLRTLSTCT